MATVQECNKCHVRKPTTEFGKRSSTKTGFRSSCKECDKGEASPVRPKVVAHKDIVPSYSKSDFMEKVLQYAPNYDVFEEMAQTFLQRSYPDTIDLLLETCARNYPNKYADLCLTLFEQFANVVQICNEVQECKVPICKEVQECKLQTYADQYKNNPTMTLVGDDVDGDDAHIITIRGVTNSNAYIKSKVSPT